MNTRFNYSLAHVLCELLVCNAAKELLKKENKAVDERREFDSLVPLLQATPAKTKNKPVDSRGS